MFEFIEQQQIPKDFHFFHTKTLQNMSCTEYLQKQKVNPKSKISY